jgi:Na+-translocating ferredoxin:NAD+ oxidoreductase subunit D
MVEVLLAVVPGSLALVWFYGAGIVLNIIIAAAAAVATEVMILTLRARPLSQVADGSALVSGILLGVCLPPFLPLWLVVIGTVFALLFGKHLYGGLGHNPFNPAMLGFAMLIVSFPLAMSAWPLADHIGFSMADTVLFKLGMPMPDGITMATPLDAFRFRVGTTVDEFNATSIASALVAATWINGGFLLGGAYLLWRGIIGWIMPASMLIGLGLLAMLFHDGGSSHSLGSPLFHWFSGATMIAAFFVITDPVTSPDGVVGQVLFAGGVALITFVIRAIGAYPDGIAFAVLLMNAATPLIDQLRLLLLSGRRR